MEPYDPLKYENIGLHLAEKLVSQPLHPLPPPPFDGLGVYAIYYCGSLAPYRSIAKKRGATSADAVPIYVGKAVSGGRKGRIEQDSGAELRQRLVQHSRSIEAATTTLELSDFECRFLVLVPIWIPLAEQLLIAKYQPLWNVTLDGFGNHDPGKGRAAMRKPGWDTVHPGRPWARGLKEATPAATIWKQVSNSLAERQRGG
jgi:hypothetical protein